MDRVSQPKDGLVNWLLPLQACLPQQTATACTFILSQRRTSTGSPLIFSSSHLHNLSIQTLSCSSSIITNSIAAADAADAAAMPPKMPRLDDLLALLEVYFAPERGTPPGGTATKAELEVQVSPDPPCHFEQSLTGAAEGASSFRLVAHPSTDFGFELAPASPCHNSMPPAYLPRLTTSRTTSRNVSRRQAALPCLASPAL
ncbi:hypothetical protein FMUND_13410 [Fusarium mundagurra]|uniref:Uncharacterized protein n=1 Tax=Fusarium mundagurra TaxID=1567541 RepID=A0A8H6D337_9HYPO|nr:hypothetical protein FMUND_13410 [Fusarium mundagurra]